MRRRIFLQIHTARGAANSRQEETTIYPFTVAVAESSGSPTESVRCKG